MKALVIGGAGYLGSHVVKGLLAQGDLSVVIDNFLSGHRELLPREVPVYARDGGLMAAVEDVLKQHPVDVVIYCAGLRGETRSLRLPFHYHHNNFIAVFYLLQAMERHNVRRFLFSSDFSVYGPEPELPLTAQSPLCPRTPVARAQCAVCELLQDLGGDMRMSYSILRLPNVAGALPNGSLGPWTEGTGRLMGEIFAVARKERPSLTIHGSQLPTPDGTPVRDFIHIADAVEAYLLALRRMQSGVNATYLLGTGQPSSIQQLVDLAAQVTHCPIPSSAGEPLAMQPAAVYADPSDARRTLQWAPRYDLRQIIESEWLWTTKHFEPFLLSRAGDAKR